MRGARRDGRVLALAIEGGGLRGAISGGMCVALEAAGLIDAVDVIYGTSSGALTGSFTAAGQAALGATNYEDAANPEFSNPLRFLIGRPVMNLGLIFDDVIAKRKPYGFDRFAAGPRFGALATNLETGRVEVLEDFDTVDELMFAVHVSCTVPLLAGPPLEYHGVPMCDGSVVESMPYVSALAGGATDVIVLRTRSAAYRKAPYPPYVPRVLARTVGPSLAELVRTRPARYNAQADELERLTREGGSVMQIAPPDATWRPSQMETSKTRVRRALETGAETLADALGLPPLHLFWQPTPHVISATVGAQVLTG